MGQLHPAPFCRSTAASTLPVRHRGCPRAGQAANSNTSSAATSLSQDPAVSHVTFGLSFAVHLTLFTWHCSSSARSRRRSAEAGSDAVVRTVDAARLHLLAGTLSIAFSCLVKADEEKLLVFVAFLALQDSIANTLV